jgi:hypothetical protein
VLIRGEDGGRTSHAEELVEARDEDGEYEAEEPPEEG